MASPLWQPSSPSVASLRTAQVVWSRKPSLRLILLSSVSCVALWFIYSASYTPPPHYPHHPHYRPVYNQPPPDVSFSVWPGRADKVREAYLHAYRGYKEHAGDHDELRPVSAGYVDNFNGWRLTLIDSLDTMWIMGLHHEFQESMSIVSNLNFTLDENTYAPFFETVIRYLGGLLSAYALSGEGVLLRRADELGLMLLPAFDTNSGLPMYAVNTGNGKTRPGWSLSMVWAEGLTCQMEYKYLAHATGRTQFYEKVEDIMTLMHNANVADGLFPTLWDTHSGKPTNADLSVGALADSAYEYLLKQYLLTGKSEPKARDLYLRSVSGIINNLLYLSPTRNLLYVTNIIAGQPTHIQEHLACFLPGLLALGAQSLDTTELSAEDRKLHKWVAEGLANTCWLTYHDSKTGLGPDEVYFSSSGAVKWVDALKTWNGEGVPPGIGDGKQQPANQRDYTLRNSKYLLRPETIESFYIMWKTTGDEKWRERGWMVFSAIEREAKTRVGFAVLNSVDQSPASLADDMPSFFMAETLKYLYLMFSDEEIIPLNKWVFNTEAHPLPIFNWSKWQKDAHNITG